MNLMKSTLPSEEVASAPATIERDQPASPPQQTHHVPPGDDVSGWMSLVDERAAPNLADLDLAPKGAPAEGLPATADMLDYLTILSTLHPDHAGLMDRTFDAAWGLAKSKRTAADKLRDGGSEAAALDLLLEAAILNSRNADNWTALANSALSCKRYFLADAASRKAVQISPRDTAANAVRAEVLIERRRLGPAKLHMLAAIENGPSELAKATDVFLRCYRRGRRFYSEKELEFDDVAGAAVARGHRDKVMAALIKAISLKSLDPLKRTLFSMCTNAPQRSTAATAKRNLPLVLISQIQRSGGTLLSQLFDGHDSVLVHPYELHIGYPQKWSWPTLDLAAPAQDWMLKLFETIITKLQVKGYAKGDGNSFAAKDRKHFSFSLETFCQDFYRMAEGAQAQRDVLDAYFSAFFNAWEGRADAPEARWFVGFCPRMISYESSVSGFLSDYPDGRLVSCIRNPISWYASSVKHTEEYASLDRAIPLWLDSTRAAIALSRARPAQVHLLAYDDLVTNTEAVMRRLADALGIAFDPILLTPTYLGQPILPNSSYEISEYGVHRRSLDQSDKLTSEARARLTTEALPLYEEALALLAPRQAAVKRKKTSRMKAAVKS